MADNYIERRMEDMKAGRLAPAPCVRPKTGLKKGVVEFPFPSRRVLIAGGVNGSGLDIVRSFLKTGCKVAVFDIDKEGGEKLAYKEGVRFHCLDLSDQDEVSKAFANLVEAWRDVDIVVIASDQDCIEVIARCWSDHRDRYPVPFGYAGRMIMLSSQSNPSLGNIKSILKRHGITVNNIVHTKASSGEARSLPRLCLMLALPGNDFIDGLRIDC